LALPRISRFPLLALGGVVFSFKVATLLWTSDMLGVLNNVAAASLVLLLCGLLLASVMGSGRVTVNRITRAIAVNLLAALLFDLLERLSPGAIVMGPQPSPLTPASARFFYLSIITLTSVGFGDMTPIHPIARSLVMVEAVSVISTI
jgi:hypothetical protein